MKKASGLLCMLLVVVMLFGPVPAHAATPMTAVASLIAVPLSGNLLSTDPIRDSMARALTVSKPAEPAPAPAPAPAPEPTPTPAPAAQAASPAPNGRLPDGTTGATVGVPGTPTYLYISYKDTFYGLNKILDNGTKKYLFYPYELTSAKAKANPTVRVKFDPQSVSPSKLAGLIIPAGCLVDVYRDQTFICQYDTRDGKDLVIPCAPGSTPEQDQANAARAPAQGRTTFNDVKPGDWYYEAVTACAEGSILTGILDRDPNGNFNPNAMVDCTETIFVWKRVSGESTDELSFVLRGMPQARHYAISPILQAISKTEQETKLAQEMAAAGHDLYSPENQSNDAKAIRQYAQQREAVNPNANTPGTFYAANERTFAHAYDLGLIRTPGSPEVIDLTAGLTRAEYCYLLWKAGLTSFGCYTPPMPKG